MLWLHVSAFGLCAALGFTLAQPCDAAATQILTYDVEHPTFGIIGTYTNRISENGDFVEVRTDLHIAVKAIGIPLYHQDAAREEQWRGQRLVRFQSATDDNGTRISVVGETEGDHFVIHSTSNGTLTAPARVHPSNPWSPFLLESGTMMSTKTGRLHSAVVTDTGQVDTTLDGRLARVHQWFVDGDKHQVVWIDGRGIIVGFQTEERGKPIRFVLKKEAADDGAVAHLPDR